PSIVRDLVLFEEQVYAARLAGADAVLLTAAAVSAGELKKLVEIAASMHMAAPVEVRSAEEVATASACGARHAVVPAFSAKGGLYNLTQDAFAEQTRYDLSQLHHFADGLRRIDDTLKKHTELWNRKNTSTFSPEEKRLLLTSWGAFFNYEMSIELIRQRYWDF